MKIDNQPQANMVKTMTPKEFYTHLETDPSCLAFSQAAEIEWAAPEELPPRDLPLGNTVVFNGPRRLFRHAKLRLSTDACWIEVASLFGSLRVRASGLDLSKPVGMLCVNGGLRVDHATCRLAMEWGPVSPKGSGAMKPRPLGSGTFEPVSMAKALRGMDGNIFLCEILLPAKPDRIAADGSRAMIESDGMLFIVSDPVAARSVLGGMAQWIVPGPDGVFAAP